MSSPEHVQARQAAALERIAAALEKIAMSAKPAPWSLERPPMKGPFRVTSETDTPRSDVNLGRARRAAPGPSAGDPTVR